MKAFLLRSLVCSGTAAIALPVLAQPGIAPLQRVVLSQAAELGQGYYYPTDSVRAHAVVSNGVTGNLASTAVSYDLKYVDDYSSLMKTLSVSASASYGAGGVGANARASFASSSSMSRRNAYVLVRMTVETRTERLREFTLRPEASSAAANLVNFTPTFGDSFISAITYGGELFALMQFSATSASESQAMKASVKASAGAFSGGASMAQTVKTMSQGKNVSVKYVQTGGATGFDEASKFKGVVTLTPEELLDRLNKFAPEVQRYPEQAKPLFGDLHDYRVVNWPTGAQAPVPGLPEPRLGAVTSTYLELKTEQVTLQDARSDEGFKAAELQNALAVRSAYVDFLVGHLEREIAGIATAPRSTEPVLLPSLDQYRVELALGLPSGVWRGNAGPLCDAAEPDLQRVMNCLYGAPGPWLFEPWPVVKAYRLIRGFNGEHANPPRGAGPPAWAGTHLGCPGITHERVQALCGAPSKDSGRVALSIIDGSGDYGGNKCGYRPYMVACVEFEKPAQELKMALPVLQRGKGELSVVEHQVENQAGTAYARFDFDAPCSRSIGAYEITTKSGGLDSKKHTGYWRTTSAGHTAVRHPVENVEAGAKVKVLEHYCEIPARFSGPGGGVVPGLDLQRTLRNRLNGVQELFLVR